MATFLRVSSPEPGDLTFKVVVRADGSSDQDTIKATVTIDRDHSLGQIFTVLELRSRTRLRTARPTRFRRPLGHAEDDEGQ